jgi:lysophospholipase L1-like esterase
MSMIPSATPTRSRRRRWMVYAPLALLLPIVALELFLRLVWGLGDPVVYQADPDCGYLPAPNQHVSQNLHLFEEAQETAIASAARMAIVHGPAVAPGWQTPNLEEGRELLFQWARRENVPLLDLTPAYSRLPVERIYKLGIHLTAEGDAVAAVAIANAFETLSGADAVPPGTGRLGSRVRSK